MPQDKRIRVLVVDDSALVREILCAGLGEDPGLEVVGTAPDPFAARDLIIKLRPDVMTLDIEMPRMDGVEFLRRLMPQYPLPVVVVSALSERGKRITLDALEAGAVDFLTKPSTDVSRGLPAMLMELRTKVKLASTANVSHWKNRVPARRQVPVAKPGALERSSDRVILLGASAGGTEALRVVVSGFPASTPGVVIVQHMPAGFTRLFASRLNEISPMEVREAQDGDRIRLGLVLVAPGGLQTRVIRSGGIYLVQVTPEAPVCGHCPSVEVLMRSAAESVGPNGVGAILTGMGNDGAMGLKALREAGARTLAQDEATSVVFGMPKVAWECGGAEEQVALPDISRRLLDWLKGG